MAREPRYRIVPPKPNPSDYRTYTDQQKRRHALRRRLHELMALPHYRLRAVDGQLIVGPAECLTDEARQFIREHKDDLLIHVQWLGEGRPLPPPPSRRAAVQQEQQER